MMSYDWPLQRIRRLCELYDDRHQLFTRPRYENGRDLSQAYINFAREVAESVGYRSTGGEMDSDDQE